MRSPRAAGLFLILFFLSGVVAISLWEAPVMRTHQLSGNDFHECDPRIHSVTRMFFIGKDESRDIRMSDSCGEEAMAWSRSVAMRREESSAGIRPFAEDILNTEIASMTAGYPIESMAPVIARYNREVAALLIGIAKKESNWGRRVPRSDDGADCFNYWGFKGAGSRGVAMGHGCFGSPEEAVEKVGNRIAELVRIRSTSEPKNFTIWKCGSSCATHSDESVRKWVSDVDQYYRMLAVR